MMTTAHAVIASGILTLVMLLVASSLCAKAWTPPGMAIAFGNRESVAARPAPDDEVQGRELRAPARHEHASALLEQGRLPGGGNLGSADDDG